MNRAVEILLVEDNPADAGLVRQALLHGSVRKNLSVVKDGIEAIDWIRRRGPFIDAARPDIVLLDWKLPRKDGADVLEEIKSDPDLRPITVIVLTASGVVTDVNTAYDLAANCYVVKPTNFDEYVRVMRSIEEFWIKTAALPTLGTDPHPPRGKDSGQPGGASGTPGASDLPDALGRALATRILHHHRSRSAGH